PRGLTRFSAFPHHGPSVQANDSAQSRSLRPAWLTTRTWPQSPMLRPMRCAMKKVRSARNLSAPWSRRSAGTMPACCVLWSASCKRLDYPEESAGRRMQTEFIAVTPAWTVGQAIDYMRETEDLPERFFEIYVVDAGGKFLGAVPLDRLMRTKRPVAMSELME